MPKNDTLTPKQVKAIAALMQARTVGDAARECGISERTLLRWLATSEFQTALRDAVREGVDAAVRRLSGLAASAVAALGKEMANQSSPPGARIRAADVILARLLALKELADLEERIAALEARTQSEGEK